MAISVYISDKLVEFFRKAAADSQMSLSEYINGAVLRRIKTEDPDLYQILVDQRLNIDRFGKDLGGD